MLLNSKGDLQVAFCFLQTRFRLHMTSMCKLWSVLELSNPRPQCIELHYCPIGATVPQSLPSQVPSILKVITRGLPSNCAVIFPEPE